ncbi:hypothetical protein EYZ11_006939 [Aspergillus tanneri]|uniref:Myb-like domain-containing protein n=1 Tax=Aspergillus tanneri TaxID=1220188 RepID=A0A4S3JE82_9EURO|nr:hypothetical protein EYZ11_006939 [Aspergillus tanneri]
MSSDSYAPGHNKEYYPHEEGMLLYLKSRGVSWIQVAEEFNLRVNISRRRTPAALENKWRQLRKASPLPFIIWTTYSAENPVPSLNAVQQLGERSNLADPPLSTIRIQYNSNQHPLIDALIKGLEDAVIVAVPLGFNQVDLAVIASETSRVYGKYKLLGFEQFSDDDPIMQRPKDVGETYGHTAHSQTFPSHRPEKYGHGLPAELST